MKKKIAITLDDELLKMVDLRRSRFGMGRSTFMNYKLKKLLKVQI